MYAKSMQRVGALSQVKKGGMVTELARKGWLMVVRSMIALLIGLAALRPGAALTTLVLLFGLCALADGLLALTVVSRLECCELEHGWMLLLKGLASIAIGAFTFLWPSVAVPALVSLIAAWVILTGAFEVAAGLGLRNAAERERRMAWDALVKRQTQMAWDGRVERKTRYAHAEQMASDKRSDRMMRGAGVGGFGHELYAGGMHYSARSTAIVNEGSLSAGSGRVAL